MSRRDIIKPILQKGISPFLSRTKPQHRFIIFHEILPSQESSLQNISSLIESQSSMQATVTFDDGFYSSYKAIKQLRNQKAIFFVCPEFINRAETENWQDFFHHNLMRKERLQNMDFIEAVRPASWADLRELVKLGHTIGSHGLNHLRLSKIVSQKELEREIIGSADLIEDKLQIKVDCFSNPFGDARSFNQQSYQIISRRYKYFFTGIRGNNFGETDALIKWRDTIHFYWPIDYIEFLLSGGFDWYYFFKRKHARKMI